MRAHERFVQCASAVSSCPCSAVRGREHVIIRSRALCSCVGACTEEFMYESQYLSTVLAPQGFVLLCTSVQCKPPRASYSVLVLAPLRFVLLCASVRCEPLCGANPQGRVLVLARQSFVPSAYVLVRIFTARARKGFVLLCSVQAQRALCGASLQRLYKVCWCSPPRALHPVLMCSCGRVSR